MLILRNISAAFNLVCPSFQWQRVLQIQLLVPSRNTDVPNADIDHDVHRRDTDISLPRRLYPLHRYVRHSSVSSTFRTHVKFADKVRITPGEVFVCPQTRIGLLLCLFRPTGRRFRCSLHMSAGSLLHHKRRTRISLSSI